MADTRLKQMIFPRNVLVGTDAIESVGEVVAELTGKSPTVVVVDKRTMELIGDGIAKSLGAAGIEAHFYQSSGPTRDSVEQAKELGGKVGAKSYIGGGGGSVIDVAKLAAFDHKVPFISVPTSASHDGICSGRASIKENHGSVSLEARPPDAIVADTAIISKAPYRMLAAGCADILSNLTAVLDWQLAHRLKAEEYSSFASVLAKSAADLILDNSKIIKPGIEAASWLVVKSLVVSGVSMAVAGTSRPASGAEHMFSHALDRLAPGKAMHGEQVGVGSIIMMQLHGGDWKMLQKALRDVGAPTTAEELGIDPDVIIEALTTCHTLRPERYTILGESGLTEAAARSVCKETGIF